MSLATYKKFENTEFKKVYCRYAFLKERILNKYRDASRNARLKEDAYADALDCLFDNAEEIEEIFRKNKEFYKQLKIEYSFTEFIKELQSYDKSIIFDFESATFEI